MVAKRQSGSMGRVATKMQRKRRLSCRQCLLLCRPSRPPAVGMPWPQAPAAVHEPAHPQLVLLREPLLGPLLLLGLMPPTCLQDHCCEQQAQVRGPGLLPTMSAAGQAQLGWRHRLHLRQQRALAGCSAAAVVALRLRVVCCGTSWKEWLPVLLLRAAARRRAGCQRCCLPAQQAAEHPQLQAQRPHCAAAGCRKRRSLVGRQASGPSC